MAYPRKCFTRVFPLALIALAFPTFLIAQTELAPIVLDGVTGTAQTCPAGTIGSYPSCYSIISGSIDTGSTPTSPTGDTGGGGGYDDPYDDPNDPDPCQTADVRLNDQNFQNDMDSIWDASNTEDNLLARTEKVAWVVRTATGYRLHEWNLPTSFSGFCDIPTEFLLENMPPEGAGAIEGFLHTHPWSIGEDWINRTCDGGTSLETYQGLPSWDDRNASRKLGAFLGRNGALMGYILDKDGIRYFWGDLAGVGSWSRCGY